MHNISIDYSRNPELAEVFSRKKPGDKCRMEVEFQVNEIDPNGVKGSINEISPHGYEASGSKDKDITPQTDEPVAIVISAHKKGNNAKATAY